MNLVPGVECLPPLVLLVLVLLVLLEAGVPQVAAVAGLAADAEAAAAVAVARVARVVGRGRPRVARVPERREGSAYSITTTILYERYEVRGRSIRNPILEGKGALT